MKCLDKVNCLDSSVVNREKEISRRGFVSSWGRCVGKVGWLIFWVCLSGFIHYGGTLVISSHKLSNCVNCMRQATLKVPVANWVIIGGVGALQQLCSETFGVQHWYFTSSTWRQKVLALPVFGIPVWGSGQRSCWCWVPSKNHLPNHMFGLVKRNC